MRQWSSKLEIAGGEAFSSLATADGSVRIFREVSDSRAQSIGIDALGGLIGSYEDRLVIPTKDIDFSSNDNVLFTDVLEIGQGAYAYFAELAYERYNYSGFSETGSIGWTSNIYTAAQADAKPTYHQYIANEHYSYIYGDYEESNSQVTNKQESIVLNNNFIMTSLYEVSRKYGYLVDPDTYESTYFDYSSSSLLILKTALSEDFDSESILIDSTPASAAQIFDRSSGLGALWINSIRNDTFVLSLARLDDDGDLVGTKSVRLNVEDFTGFADFESITILDAISSKTAGVTFASVKIDGDIYTVRLDASLRVTQLTKEATATDADVQFVALPQGGVVSVVEIDGPGRNASIYLQQYSEQGAAVGDRLTLTTSLSSELVDVNALDDGRLIVVWNENGKAYQQIVDTRIAGLNEIGGATADTFVGTAFVDVFQGEGGSDRMAGGAGNDRLYGGAGNDFLVGGLGADKLVGGADHDTVRFETKVTVDLENGAANTGEAAGDIYSSIEQFRGSLFDDRMFGDAAANVLEGRSGDDALLGRGGADTLIGGSGADRLTGGAGADVFRFNGGESGVDEIRDFTRGEDKIGVLKAGFDLTSLVVISNGDPVATTATPTFLFDTDSKLLSFDADGSGGGAAVALATLAKVTTLAASDFLLL